MSLPEPFNVDVLDFPTAWAIQKTGGLEHHERCSSVEGWHPLSGPGLLCDCGAVRREYARLNATGHDAGGEVGRL